MTKSKMLAMLLALSSLVAHAQTGNRLTDTGASALVSESVKEDRAKARFGVTLNQLEGEACLNAHRKLSGLDPAKTFDALPSYECQAWYAHNKYQGLFTAAPIASQQQYQEYLDDVARVRLIAKKVADLELLRKLSVSASLQQPLAATDQMPASLRTLLLRLRSLDTLPATLASIRADVSVAEKANPMVPASQRGGTKQVAAEITETAQQREARLLGDGQMAASPVAGVEPPNSADISRRVLSAYRALPKLSPPVDVVREYLAVEFGGEAKDLASRVAKQVAAYAAAKQDVATQTKMASSKPGYILYQIWLTKARDQLASWTAAIEWYKSISAEPGCAAWVPELLVALQAVQ